MVGCAACGADCDCSRRLPVVSWAPNAQSPCQLVLCSHVCSCAAGRALTAHSA